MPEWIISVLVSANSALLNLIPYVLVGVILSELLKYISWGNILTKLAVAAPSSTVLFSVLLGIASPMCTYGSLPIVLTLFSMGFPAAALISFLIASSLMNPQLFIITWGGISPELALIRLVAISLFSLLLGFLLLNIDAKWIVNPNLMNNNQVKTPGPKKFIWLQFLKNSWRSLQFIGFYIIIGVLTGAVVDVLVPVEWLFLIFRNHEWLGILIGALLGIPLYACGGGTIPLIAVMIDNGMSIGAALAFFIVGPMTRITPLIALATIMRARFIIFIILFNLLYAILVGIVATGIL